MGAMGAAYIANRIAPSKLAVPVPVPEPEAPSDLKDLIKKKFTNPQIKSDIAELMVEFIEKPVVDFKAEDRQKISSDLKKIYLATHPDKGQCPGKLGELCGMIFAKARSIDKFTKEGVVEGEFTGNLSDPILEILNSPESE
jgi:hypothetical protein